MADGSHDTKRRLKHPVELLSNSSANEMITQPLNNFNLLLHIRLKINLLFLLSMSEWVIRVGVVQVNIKLLIYKDL